MKTDIDPRLAARRTAVAEGHARSRLGRLLLVLTVAGMIGAAVWALNSPWFSVQHLHLLGVSRSDTAQILKEQGLAAGLPLISIKRGEVEAALRQDPWVAEAKVEVQWPQTVVVRMVERVPVAWSRLTAGWGLWSVDGTLLAEAPQPAGAYPLVEVASTGTEPSPGLLAGLAFLAELPAVLAPDARLEEREGELWATVGGFAVRLGPPNDMGAKARALTAVLEADPEPGSIITVIAPNRPAVRPPGVDESESQVEGES